MNGGQDINERRKRTRPSARRAGTYLEVQVALVIFSFGVSGLIPLSVVNSRQLQAIQEQLPDDQIIYLNPPTDSWSSKLGAAATQSLSPPASPTPVVDLLDDADVSFQKVDVSNSDWFSISSASALGGQMQVNYGDEQGDYCHWTFSGLPPKEYEVFATWAAQSFLTANADFEIHDGWTYLGEKRVNQTNPPPTGHEHLGLEWKSLGTFVITSGELNVRLEDDDDGYIAADAIRIEPVTYRLEVKEFTKSPSTSSLHVRVRAKR